MNHKVSLLLSTIGLTCWLSAYPATSYSQTLAYNLQRSQQNDPKTLLLRDAILEIKEHYHVDILFEEDIVENKRIDSKRIDMSLSAEKNLQNLLKASGLQLKKLKKNTYVIVSEHKSTKLSLEPMQSPNIPMNNSSGNSMTFTSMNKVGQVAAFPVKGKITDEKGEGLPGVSVVIKGTNLGVATDVQGNYSINVPDEQAILVFSAIGYTTEEVTVGARSTIDFQMVPDIKSLNEVVVVGYGTQKKPELSTSVATVNSKELSKQTVAGFDQALQGQAAGVQVTAPTGAPGSGINIRIRGNNSISLTNSPLYVIDGVPVLPSYDSEVGIGNQRPNPLNTLNPNDIESIDVLKDGASAAIYGSRAANGVVVITTKRGKAGKPQVTFNTYFSQQELRKKLDVLNGQQFATLYDEALVNAGRDKAFGQPDTVRTNTNWQDLLYRTAPIKSYQLSVQGGGDKTKYYLSGAYFDQDGIIKNSGFKRISFKLNLDQEITKRFRAGSSLNISRTDNNRSVRSELGLGNSGVIMGALTQIPTMPVYKSDGSYGQNTFTFSDNPYSNLNETHNQALIYQAIGNLYGEFDILDNLTFRTNGGIDFRTQNENQFISREYAGTQNSASSDRGSGQTGRNEELIWLWENTLTYKPKIGDNQNLTILGGYSAQASNRFTSGASVYGYPSDAVPYLSAATKYYKPYSYQDQWGLVSYFVRGTYAYGDRYYATASIRADGSSRFNKSNRFGYFPALSLGWRISSEAFFPKSKALSDLKLRLSYGANGNQNIGVYDRFSTYSAGYNYQGGNGIDGGIVPNVIGNDKLKWETTNQYDAGLDIGLLDNRITVTADVYLKRTNDLLTQVPLAYSTGSQQGQVAQNLGTIENKGFELGITSTNIRMDNGFTWTTQFNISTNKNTVIDLGTLTDETGKVIDKVIINNYSITKKDLPLGSFYGYKMVGIFQNQNDIDNAATQPGAKPGDIQFADINGDKQINGDDRVVLGNPNPKFFGGITNTFAYKGIDLSFLFQGSFGNDIYNATRQALETMMSSATNGSPDVLNRWTPTNTETNMPRVVYGDPNNNNRFSNRFVEDGTYVRLKNLTLGYTLPASLLSKAKISNLRVYVTGLNLLTFTKYRGYDPEVSADPFSSTSFGRDFGVYPQARTYTIGLNLQF
ncbi:TonB-dependent receptor [Xanthocytophaga agilis]|uniref:TonB-dependent receptor n=1 Tax=Xanthocytophaga agilis TaxID=3048010 RepID=A0AAE3R1Z1_9BACT|nr:TonB-dependent receptor [Xanthocytophaga agilis]MDJ1499192.1 TonB-dependent receptor [Xanthocytophaga agilis]